MTLPTPLVADTRLLERVREVTGSDRTLATAIHDGAAALGIQVRWHEADVLAEAVRGHHDVALEIVRFVHRDFGLASFREHHARRMREELVTESDAKGYALVSEPVETVHVTPLPAGFLTPLPASALDVEADAMRARMSPAWSDERVTEYLAGHPGYCAAVVLAGRFRKLGKAT